MCGTAIEELCIHSKLNNIMTSPHVHLSTFTRYMHACGSNEPHPLRLHMHNAF